MLILIGTVSCDTFLLKNVFSETAVTNFFYSAGPFSVNGVPLRRVAQAYVIATQTKVDIDGVNLPESLNDDYFRRSGAKSSGEGIFADSRMVSIAKIFRPLTYFLFLYMYLYVKLSHTHAHTHRTIQ